MIVVPCQLSCYFSLPSTPLPLLPSPGSSAGGMQAPHCPPLLLGRAAALYGFLRWHAAAMRKSCRIVPMPAWA